MAERQHENLSQDAFNPTQNSNGHNSGQNGSGKNGLGHVGRADENQRERGFLVGADIYQSRPLLSTEDSLDELAQLADTAGMKVTGRAIQKIRHIDVSTYIGSGKVQEIKDALAQLDAQTVIFDDELEPRHQRELERIFGDEIKVIDRSALILDIFAQHAQTKEGALQVELAQYEYRLPRLTRQWTHLARQVGGGGGRGGNGGVGLRGPGETQLEVDRREIGKLISKLKKDLEQVRAHRSRHRAQRSRSGIPMVSLVGYTNAGKSTLLNRLTGAGVYIADQLFATLDPTTRRLTLPGGKVGLFTDTVGFIQKLPTSLIAAFQATLEEVTEADILIHVVDASHPHALQQIESVEDTLAEIDVPRIPRILALNKIDQCENNMAAEKLLQAPGYAAVVQISAMNNIGMDDFRREIERVIIGTMLEIKVSLPFSRGDLVAMIRENGIVDEEKYTETGVEIRAHVPPRTAALFTNMQEPEAWEKQE